jgi:sigma-B regulation protein RsbU (phosphoserine phosphatase)
VARGRDAAAGHDRLNVHMASGSSMMDFSGHGAGRRWLERMLRPATKLGKVTWYSFVLWLALWPLVYLHGGAGGVFQLLRFVLIWVFVCAGLPLLVRVVRDRLLWRLSNRLVVNYLLIGLSPFVLLTILFALIGYMSAGQFAIFAATQVLDREVNRLASENNSFVLHAAHDIGRAGDSKKDLVFMPEPESVGGERHANRTVNIFVNHSPVSMEGTGLTSDPTIKDSPDWFHGPAQGLYDDHGQIYLRAVDSAEINGRVVTAITSEPLDQTVLAKTGEGLGRVTLASGVVHEGNASDKKAPKGGINVDLSDGQGVKVTGTNSDGVVSESNLSQNAKSGGNLPAPAGFYDVNVTFLTPLAVKDWTHGDALTTTMSVSSRPSVLYSRLFSSSLLFGTIIRFALITIAVIFAIIELIALVMAQRLNRTITKNISNLYQATLRVDAGDLTHQIEVKSSDQLAELSRSFNRMTASLKRLLAEQKENERLQNELAIAQEVQANLFPQGNFKLPGLEVHGVCQPARTVSGDYYDFLLFGETGMGLALGDISGKGISAALLMATLHSAVRAYRYAAEELIYAEMIQAALKAPGVTLNGKFDYAELFESPGKVLTLLNRHLYRSTQPEKYATLFLGHYDGVRSRLTYSNGGQLPPLVLHATGKVTRLDCGGTVVGLLDAMEYEEGSVDLAAGDIVIAYSDGVTEPENEFGDFGEERLVEIVRRHQHQPLQAISDQVMTALVDWIGAQEQPDDITLVLARQK